MRAIIPLTLAISACAPAQPPEGADPIRVCSPEPLSAMVGQAWSDSMQAEALRLSRARTARVIRPGDMVTMDYRSDRLNVHLTTEGRVDRFDCG